MEKTLLELEVKEYILQNLNETKATVQRQTHTFGNLLLTKISENFKSLDKGGVQRLYVRTFATRITEEIDAIFNKYEIEELDFYNKNLKTADLIFNTLDDRRTQRIYLGNLIKKINQKSEDVNNIFNQSSRIEMNSHDKFLCINAMLEEFGNSLASNPKLSMDEAEDLKLLINHYFNIYKKDFLTVFGNFLENIKDFSVSKIEEEMDNKQVINGKTSAVSKMERNIINNSLKVMEQKLEKNINTHKEKALVELKECSSSIVDLIFKKLPSEYQDQKGLLEIIVDTNINERLGKLLNVELKKLASNLAEKNENIIENELYEEKRYNEINDYVCDFDLIDKVYQDILHEICIAYDIPEPGKNSTNFVQQIRLAYNMPELDEKRLEMQSKRLRLIILSESDSTKKVFKNVIDKIHVDNAKNLKSIIVDMHVLSEKAYINVNGNQHTLSLNKH